MNTNWYVAQMLLLIWNPDLWNFFQNKRRRRVQQLKYRAKGIVLHDRALNGERVWTAP